MFYYTYKMNRFVPLSGFSFKRIFQEFSQIYQAGKISGWSLIIIIIIIIYELIVHSLTWKWSAAHYNCITLKETNKR